MAVIGHLKVVENFMVRRKLRGVTEYQRGQLIELHEMDWIDRYKLLIDEGIVEFLDAKRKPSTKEEISKLFWKPEQRPLIANKVKPKRAVKSSK